MATSGEKRWPRLGRTDGRTWGETDGHCPSMTAKGTRFRVTIKRGNEVKCSTADSVLRTFLSGHGTMHGPANGPAYLQTWTVPYGWTCGYGTGGGACIRGGSSSQNAHDWIEAQEQ